MSVHGGFSWVAPARADHNFLIQKVFLIGHGPRHADFPKPIRQIGNIERLNTGGIRRKLDLPGREKAFVTEALPFLMNYREKGKADVKNRVLVIGGGSVAADAAVPARSCASGRGGASPASAALRARRPLGAATGKSSSCPRRRASSASWNTRMVPKTPS